MKKRYLYILISICVLFSCKQNFFRMSAGSMENTIKTGQTFFVKARTDFEKNDIVAFEYYGPDYQATGEDGKFQDVSHKRIFRLVAISGDLLQIKDGVLFVNSQEVPTPPKGKENYEIKTFETLDRFQELDEFGSISPSRNDTLVYLLSLTKETVNELRQLHPKIVSIKRVLITGTGASHEYIARPSKDHQWVADQYGPLAIPKVGDTINVNEENHKLYKNIPGIIMGVNTIFEKLYFVLGDNRYSAEDSRYIGYISHSKMFGVVKL